MSTATLAQVFTVYDTSNTPMTNHHIGSINIHNGTLWLGTLGGLVKWDGTNWTTYNTSNSGLLRDIITDVDISSTGEVWAANYNRGVVSYNGINTWSVYNTTNSGLVGNSMASMTIDSNDVKWIGTFSGLSVFDGSTWTNYHVSNSGLPDNDVRELDFDANGNAWIPTWGGGVAKFDGTNWTTYNFNNSPLPSDNVPVVRVDAAQNIWMGTTIGLAKFDGTNWTVFDNLNSPLPTNDIRALEFNDNGEVFIGTRQGGLAVYDGTNWTIYNWQNSPLPSDEIWSLEFDSTTGILWIGTNLGLVKMENALSSPSLPQQEDIKIFPNPSKGQFELLLPNQTGAITITDMLGRIVQPTQVVQDRATIQLEVPQGVYLLQLKIEDKVTTKLLKVN